MEEIALLPVQGWAIVDCVESLKIACSNENDLQRDRPRSRCKPAWSHTVNANSRLIVFVSILVIIVKWKQYFSEEETIKSKWHWYLLPPLLVFHFPICIPIQFHGLQSSLWNPLELSVADLATPVRLVSHNLIESLVGLFHRIIDENGRTPT